jgi:adenylate cyclase
MTSQFCEVGILFGDVAGSTRLYDAFGDRAALSAIDGCLRLISESVIAHGGVVVKTIGDELMAAFSRPSATYAAAIDIQRKMDLMAPLAGPRGHTKLQLRVGFHFGPALEDKADFFGDTVNVAARMVGIAKGGQIITTAEMIDLLSPAQRGTTRELDVLPVKGKASGVRVVEVLWQESSGMTTMFNIRRFDEAETAGAKQLRFKQGERDWLFDNGHDSVALGREATNDVVVANSGASRNHATVERRRDKWVLIDHSTNGTFVTFSGEEEIRLYREELILRGAGLISFGRPASGAPADCIRFALV